MRRHLGTGTGQGLGAGNPELSGGRVFNGGLIGTITWLDGVDHTFGGLGASDDLPDDASAVLLDGTPRSAVDVPASALESGCVTPTLPGSAAADTRSVDDAAASSTAVRMSGTTSLTDSAEARSPPTDSEADRLSAATGVANRRVSTEDPAAFGTDSTPPFGLGIGGVDDSGCAGLDVGSSGMVSPS